MEKNNLITAEKASEITGLTIPTLFQIVENGELTEFDNCCFSVDELENLEIIMLEMHIHVDPKFKQMHSDIEKGLLSSEKFLFNR